MNRIALLTSNHRRHRWLAAQLAEVANLVSVVSEVKPSQEEEKFLIASDEVKCHLKNCNEREAFWFQNAPNDFMEIATDVREVAWQGANTLEIFEFLKNSAVDIIFLFGSSIIRDPLLNYFRGRIINIHLGLSPYYRGSATNYWPLVDNLPECVGVTIHHASRIVDGGGIFAQARPDIDINDNVYDMGCKSIIAGAKLLQQVALLPLPLPLGMPQIGSGKLCRRADFSENSLLLLKHNIECDMLKNYLKEKLSRDALFPIFNNLSTYSS